MLPALVPALITAACFAPPTPQDAAPIAEASAAAAPSADAPALRLRWLLEPDARRGSVRLAPDGSGVLALDDAAAVPLAAAPARAAAIDALRARRDELPRWEHVSGTFAGARVWIDLDGVTVHDAAHVLEPAVRELLGALARSGQELTVALAPVQAAAPGRGPRLVFRPGDDPAPLGAALRDPGGDAALRHLAARIAIAERALVLAPMLRDAFEHQRDTRGEGDYFTASTLLRLGDPIGLSRVLAVLQSSRPEWVEEARADLRACLPAAALPPESVTGEDAARHVAEWWRQHRAQLRYDPATGRYRMANGS